MPMNRICPSSWRVPSSEVFCASQCRILKLVDETLVKYYYIIIWLQVHIYNKSPLITYTICKCDYSICLNESAEAGSVPIWVNSWKQDVIITK